jgi:formyltetrahydrofolate-dependent phosphoribosylglycinamide formyltransferase
MKRQVAVLISGRGSNLAALLAAANDPAYPAEIALVLSNRADAAGLKLSNRSTVVPHGPDRQKHEAAIDEILQRHRIDIVCLAGYMRLLTPFLVDRWRGRMLNIHPSLLPVFPGLNTHARALQAGVKLHGCTVHLVTEQMDGGPILAQAVVPVLPDDTEQVLAARVLAQEHLLYPLALERFAGGPGRVLSPQAALINAP